MNDKINAKADLLSDILREKLEGTEFEVKKIVYKYLNKTDSKMDYKRFQQTLVPSIQKELALTLLTEKKELFKMIENTQKIAEWNTKEIKKQIETSTKALKASVYREYKGATIEVLRMRKTDDLTKAIFKQTQKGISTSARVRVKYGKGTRSFGYKEYMENKMRTAIQTGISEEQIKRNSISQVVFYVSNVFSDCAPDHKDYQGKYYYDDRWESYNLTEETKLKIRRRIKQLKMLSIQAVREEPIWFTTRPNCRHKLIPVSITRVLENSSANSVEHYNLSSGKYDKKKYELSQQQRYNERQIRYFERREKQNNLLYKQTGDEQYLIAKNKDKFYKAGWDKRLTKLVKANKLKRDVRRETASIVWKDAGAKYQLQK